VQHKLSFRFVGNFVYLAVAGATARKGAKVQKEEKVAF
jgi:hypothetical protein